MSRKLTVGAITVLALAVTLGLAWVLLEPPGASHSASVADTASIQESVQVQAAGPSTLRQAQDVPGSGQAQAQPPPGGATERVSVQESVEYIIRDASGRIKEQRSIGGQ